MQKYLTPDGPANAARWIETIACPGAIRRGALGILSPTRSNQQVFGRADAAFHALAARAVEGLTAAIGMSVFLFLFSYRRYFRRIPEMMETQSSGPGRIRRFASQTFARFALRGEFERACFFFAVKTLFRSQRHRLMMAGFTGLGLAIAVQDFASDRAGQLAWETTYRAQCCCPLRSRYRSSCYRACDSRLMSQRSCAQTGFSG